MIEIEITQLFGSNAEKISKLVDDGYDLRIGKKHVEGRLVVTLSAYKFGVDAE